MTRIDRFRIAALGGLCVAFLLGCQPPSLTPPGPSVIAIDPSSGTGEVPTSSEIKIDFDLPLDSSSLVPGVARVASPSGPVPGVWRIEPGKVRMVFTATGGLPAGETIEVEITTALRGTNGSSLESAFQAAFRTSGAPRLRAGAAAVDVTPPVGVPLAGFGGGNRRNWSPDLDPNNYHQFMKPSTGVRDPLVVKVLVLDDGEDRIAIVKTDLVAIDQGMVEDVARRTEAQTGIPAENLYICATHTHSGPGNLSQSFLWQMITMDIFQSAVYEQLIAGVARGVIEANDRLAPARIGIGQAPLNGVQRNRRGHPGRFDPTLSVVRVDRPDGSPIAVLFNIAIHPICLGTSSLDLSADWPGRAESEIERQLPGSVALFINAAEGDVSPVGRGDSGIRTIGDAVAGAALSIRSSITVRSTADLESGAENLVFPKAQLHYSCNQPANASESSQSPIDYCWVYRTIFGNQLTVTADLAPLVPMSFTMRAFRIDDTAFVTFPGEPITNVGRLAQTRAQALGYRNTIVFGLCGGHAAYITTPEEYDEGGYEALASLYGRQQGVMMVDALEKILRRIK